MNQYNSQTIKKSFNENYTESDWNSDCTLCANSEHTELTTDQCQMCADYSPIITTFSWMDGIILGLMAFIVVKTIQAFIRK